MRETPQDLTWLQDVLDRSYASAGAHLASIHTEAARVTAEDLVSGMQGMQILVVATVSVDGRPLTGPVDGYLYRGRLCFGTSPEAVRTCHLGRSPAVSATHVRGETLVVTVHGQARPLDLHGADAGFVEVAAAHDGPGSEAFITANPHWAIEPHRMYAADMSVHTAARDAQ